jgi:2-iminoacetate synthase
MLVRQPFEKQFVVLLPRKDCKCSNKIYFCKTSAEKYFEMAFKSVFDQYNWNLVSERFSAFTAQEVEQALYKKGKRTLDDFAALISPAAAPYLEQMAQISQEITLRRFGNTVQMYAPAYLSNECHNICTYCGFSFDNKIARLTLSEEQMHREFEAIKTLGFDHILLVTGEANATVHTEYFNKAIDIANQYFSNISIEVQPLEEEDYKSMHEHGAYAILVYQETYHQANYPKYHPKGKKSNFYYRLDTPDRVGRAGFHKIGLGVLLGLEDWRTDSFFTALHLDYLEKKYWQTKFSISFPRIRPNESCFEPNVHMSDKELVQLMCAYRIFNENVELSISTRESAAFRDNAFKFGATSMSAGSKTEPGGYALNSEALEQFTIDDQRTPQQFARVIRNSGYEAVWKDWFQQ